MTEFYSHGKLLITSEYAVLDGAKALAVATTYGQGLKILSRHHNHIKWTSFDDNDTPWFQAKLKETRGYIEVISASNTTIAERLCQILNAAIQLSTTPFELNGLVIETHLDFNRNWGLGTSSTLINNIANWFQINAYSLLAETFGGSGYDIACAQLSKPLIYKLSSTGPLSTPVKLHWDFTNQLYFVYLNQKQNSRSGISDYRSRNRITEEHIEQLNSITAALITTRSFEVFEALVQEHNTIISYLIGQDSLQQTVFSDFNGTIKNLGAWGGDFILVTSKTNPTSYFNSKGLSVVIPFSTMVK